MDKIHYFIEQYNYLDIWGNQMEINHPWYYIQQELTKKGWTQKVFAQMLWKKISEINELIKGKRNITIQWDILLSVVFDDPEQKRIKLQNNYDYVIVKASMNEKIQEMLSKKKKSKEHEAFEDF